MREARPGTETTSGGTCGFRTARLRDRGADRSLPPCPVPSAKLSFALKGSCEEKMLIRIRELGIKSPRE